MSPCCAGDSFHTNDCPERDPKLLAHRKSKAVGSRGALVTWRGRQQSMIAWALELGIPLPTLRSRLLDYGWTVDRAMSEPINASQQRQRRAQPPPGT